MSQVLVRIPQFKETRRSLCNALCSALCNQSSNQDKLLSGSQLSKKYHPDVAKDDPSQTRFHAVSEAYAILGNDRKRREYDRSLGSPFRAHHAPGQHPQATTARPSQQPGSKHFWPNHPRNRTGDPTGGYPRPDYLYERARGGSATSQRMQSQASDTGLDPFSSPFVQRATGHRRSGDAQPNYHYTQGGFQSTGSAPRAAAGSDGRRGSTQDGHPSRDEAGEESSVVRALGASGLVGVIMLITAIACDSKRTL